MVADPNNPLSFLSGFVQDRNTGRVIAQVDELKDAGSTASRLLKWTRTDGRWYSFRLTWHATRMCVLQKPELHLLAVGPTGEVSVSTAAGDVEEEIDPSDEGPKRRGHIRDLRVIGEYAYVSGMSRQVYRREGPGVWSRQDSGTVLPRGAIELAGFNAIDGLSEDDIYAVGFGGEIWRRYQGNWRRLESPTDVVLHRIRVIAPDLVYISGQGGVLLRGFGDSWEVIPHEATEADLWGMEWYRERLYVACDDGMFVLSPDDDLQQIDLGLGEPWTCRHLHANDGVMWSFGPKHLAWTEDAVTWHDVTP